VAAKTPEEIQIDRSRREPSNLEIISAFARSEHLDLFEVGNTSRQSIYVLASSKRNAAIIAKYCNHIEAIKNAIFYKVQIQVDPKSAIKQAIANGIPGTIWIYKGYVITRDTVYYDKPPYNPISSQKL